MTTATATTAFVYRTFIRTTPERLWDALTAPEFTDQYWKLTFETDWQPGSPMTWVERGGRTEDPAQVVLEADPPKRLAYSWHTFTPEWAERVGVDAETLSRLQAEPRSKVTFEIEPLGQTVQLTVTHDGLVPDGALIGMITGGWSYLIANIKTLLETGELLPES